MTRREFLALVGAGATGTSSLLSVDSAVAKPSPTSSPTSTSAPATAPSAWDLLPTEKSLVVEARSPRVVAPQGLNVRRLASLVDKALRQVTDKANAADAWHSILKDDDIIGLKFNSSGAQALATNEPFARILVESLTRSGWTPEKIVLIEVGHTLTKQLKTTPRATGWQSKATDFGSGRDQLASVLDQVTAIVNVPFLKANPIAGMSGCLKNLSHALVRHPAHYHANQAPIPTKGVLKPGTKCAPYVGDIVGCPAVRGKLRLHIANALRTICKAKYNPISADIDSYGAVIAGLDPVAIDMIGLDILNRQRKTLGLTPLTKPEEPLPQLRAATESGVGAWQPDFIDHVTVRA